MRGWVSAHAPLLLRTFDAALAASLAWALVAPWGGVADRYPYYAPLGAVIATAGSVVASVRGSLETVRNLVIGAFLGTAVQALGLTSVVGLALVVAAGTALQGTARLATSAPWVSYSAVFVLVIGGDDPVEYGVAYAGLTSLGALVGITVIALLPPLLTAPGPAVLAAAGSALAHQLDDLADGLRSSGPPTEEQWAERRHALEPVLRHLADTVRATDESQRANWRARWQARWQRSTSPPPHGHLPTVLGASFPLVEHLTLLLTHDERADLSLVALGPELRPHAAEALAAWAELLRHVVDTEPEGARDGAQAALTRLADHVRDPETWAVGDSFTAAAVVSTVRRGLELTA